MEKRVRVHELKTWPGTYDQVLQGNKLHEIRRNDRGFVEGDAVVLQEFDPSPRSSGITKGYTKREMYFRIGYVSEGVFELPQGYCVFTLLPSTLWMCNKCGYRDGADTFLPAQRSLAPNGKCPACGNTESCHLLASPNSQ